MKTLVLLILQTLSVSVFANTITYQCDGENLSAAIRVTFLSDNFSDSRETSEYESVARIWIDKDSNKEHIISESSTFSFFRVRKLFNRRDWDYDYNRRVLILGGTENLKNDISPHGTQDFYTLTISKNLNRAKLVWGFNDQRGGPTIVCMMGYCGQWRNMDYNADCRRRYY